MAPRKKPASRAKPEPRIPIISHTNLPEFEDLLTPTPDEIEANDPHLIRKMAEGVCRIVHNDELIPKGMDNICVLVNMAFNGETLLVRRAAVIEMAAFLRRQGTALKGYQQAIHDQAHIISDKAQDFPQAKEINDACQAAFGSIMGNIQPRMQNAANMAYDDDVAEALGINHYVREQVAGSVPGAAELYGVPNDAA